MKSPIRFDAKTKRQIRFVLTSSVVLSVVLSFAACSPGFAPKFASQQRMLLPETPDQPLSPSVDDPTPEADPIYNIYRLISAKFGASANKKEISARILVQSTQGTETVDLLGKIREDGTATLVDIQPLEGGKNRLVAEAYCQDGLACKQIILNVVFKVGTRTLRKQFVSDDFVRSVGGKPRTGSASTSGNARPGSPAAPQPAPQPGTSTQPPAGGSGSGQGSNNDAGTAPDAAADGTGANDPADDTSTDGSPTTPNSAPSSDVSRANSIHHRVSPDKIIHAQPVPAPLTPAPAAGGNGGTTTPAAGGATVPSTGTAPNAGVQTPGAGTAPQTTTPAAPGAASGNTTSGQSPTTATGGSNSGAPTPDLGQPAPADDDDGEMTDLDNAGEYVGVQPPESTVDTLWVRPEVPPPPAQLPAASGKPVQQTPAKPGSQAPAPTGSGNGTGSGSAPATGSPANPSPGTGSNPADNSGNDSGSGADAAPATQPDHFIRGVNPNRGGLSSDDDSTTSTSGTAGAGAGTAAPAPTSPAPTSPTTPQAPAPQTQPTRPTAGPATSPAGRQGRVGGSTPAAGSGTATTPPPPAIARAQDIPQDANKSDLEKQMSPMLDLRNGGKAVGSYDSGRLITASQLSGQGVYHVLYPQRERQYGTGMMISLIKNATSLMPGSFPNQTISVLIGDIAKQTGGNVGHASHQNGLDIDIPYIGEKGFTNISNGVQVDPDFDYSKTWQFLRLVHSQRLMLNGREQSALSMVFVDKSIKVGFCRWAKTNDLLKNPEDADILRRLYPWVGHRNHFHVRLKCSPHYPACQNRNDPAPGTGC